MILFDSHCHLDDKSYDNDRNDVIRRAAQENMIGMMIVGIDLETSQKAIDIASHHNHVITSVGIHPHDARHCDENVLTRLVELANTHDCVRAWGETGLDFNRMFSPVQDQEACFTKQLYLAGELDLPLIFHERDSDGRFYEILKSEGPAARKGVVHCFSGTREEMFKYLDLGYYIGITGILTIQQRGEYLRSIVPRIPQDRILIETDAPYLTPAPIKNKIQRNEPGFVRLVMERLAQVRQEDIEELSAAVCANTQKFYGTNFNTVTE